MTDYVATRWYRAPEILLGSPKYSSSIDMWALGCIIAELYLNKPLFPGSSTLNQISRILEITGIPEQEDLVDIHSPLAMTMFESLNFQVTKRPLSEIFANSGVGDTNKEAIKLIDRMLKFNPSKRISAEEALDHPYISFRLKDPVSEKKCKRKIKIDLDDNSDVFEVDEYRRALLKIQKEGFKVY